MLTASRSISTVLVIPVALFRLETEIHLAMTLTWSGTKHIQCFTSKTCTRPLKGLEHARYIPQEDWPGDLIGSSCTLHSDTSICNHHHPSSTSVSHVLPKARCGHSTATDRWFTIQGLNLHFTLAFSRFTNEYYRTRVQLGQKIIFFSTKQSRLWTKTYADVNNWKCRVKPANNEKPPIQIILL